MFVRIIIDVTKHICMYFVYKTSEFWGHGLWVFPQRTKLNKQKSKNVAFDMKTSFESVYSGKIGVCAQKYVYRGVSTHIFDEKKLTNG